MSHAARTSTAAEILALDATSPSRPRRSRGSNTPFYAQHVWAGPLKPEVFALAYTKDSQSLIFHFIKPKSPYPVSRTEDSYLGTRVNTSYNGLDWNLVKEQLWQAVEEVWDEVVAATAGILEIEDVVHIDKDLQAQGAVVWRVVRLTCRSDFLRQLKQGEVRERNRKFAVAAMRLV